MASKFVADVRAFTDKFELDRGFEIDRDMPTRISMIREEADELEDAFLARDPVGVIDALIDLIYFEIGTLLMFGVPDESLDKHWDAVQRANMSKVRGTKSTRPGSLGRDTIKPPGWRGPEDEHLAIMTRQV